MHELSIQELIYVFKIIAYFVGIIGGIIVIGLGVIAYFYKSDRKQNLDDHKDLFGKSEDNSIEIAKIKGSLGIE